MTNDKWVCCECGDVVSDITEHLQAHGVVFDSDEYYDLLGQCAHVNLVDWAKHSRRAFNGDKGKLAAALADYLEYAEYLRQTLQKGVQA